MVAKIVKGKSFKGVVNYVLDKAKQTQLFALEGVRLKSRESIIRSFVTQAGLNPKVSQTVGHISLDFSAQNKDKLTNEKMVQIAKEYMSKMGITNAQYIIGRHYDKEHPHIHIIFNRVNNEGKTISDKNDRYRKEKICKELIEKHSLYFAQGKENIKVHRLKESDKMKYAIYDVPTGQYVGRNRQSTPALPPRQGRYVGFRQHIPSLTGRRDELCGIFFYRHIVPDGTTTMD
jgi:hypothetical protein